MCLPNVYGGLSNTRRSSDKRTTISVELPGSEVIADRHILYNNRFVVFSKDSINILNTGTASWDPVETEPSWAAIATDLWHGGRQPSFISLNDRIVGIIGYLPLL